MSAQEAPCAVGDRVCFLAVGDRQRKTLDVTLVERMDSGQWLTGGRRPSRQHAGHIGWSARVVPAEAVEVLRVSELRTTDNVGYARPVEPDTTGSEHQETS